VEEYIGSMFFAMVGGILTPFDNGRFEGKVVVQSLPSFKDKIRLLTLSSPSIIILTLSLSHIAIVFIVLISSTSWIIPSDSSVPPMAPLLRILFAFMPLFVALAMADSLKSVSKEQIQCTMCSSCQNPCNPVPSPPPPSPPPPASSSANCPPPPSPPSSGGGGSYYYSPPPPAQYTYSSPPPPSYGGGGGIGGGGTYYPPPYNKNYPTPPPPNPIVPYFPFYYYSPPPPSTAAPSPSIGSSVPAIALFSSLFLLLL
ncbi:leucine-rich repeat extensin-like protein 3, partial [Prosopis cineraria]|uniref:leucine-rich repeat extensin-like protein 3 n=1 Tax=Prosopis cineraria TaxID=364024 RepID=UPI00240F13CF